MIVTRASALRRAGARITYSRGGWSLRSGGRRRRGAELIAPHIRAEDLVGAEWAEWFRLTPAERLRESGKLWDSFLALGGSLDPEPDTQSPFFDADAPGESAAHLDRVVGPGYPVRQ
jgi:hypothetical protein